MTIEGFILYNLTMLVGGWYLLKTHGEKEYEAGIMEGIQMHNSGRLTYKSYFDDEGMEMLDIKIKEYED